MKNQHILDCNGQKLIDEELLMNRLVQKMRILPRRYKPEFLFQNLKEQKENITDSRLHDKNTKITQTR